MGRGRGGELAVIARVVGEGYDRVHDHCWRAIRQSCVIKCMWAGAGGGKEKGVGGYFLCPIISPCPLAAPIPLPSLHTHTHHTHSPSHTRHHAHDITHSISNTLHHALDITQSTSHTLHHTLDITHTPHTLSITHSTSHTLHHTLVLGMRFSRDTQTTTFTPLYPS